MTNNWLMEGQIVGKRTSIRKTKILKMCDPEGAKVINSEPTEEIDSFPIPGQHGGK